MVWSYPSHFLSFSVSFHICKMGVRMTPYSQSCFFLFFLIVVVFDSQSFSEKLK